MNRPSIKQIEKDGDKMEIPKAIRLLSDIYIKMCGISYGYQIVLWCAANVWFGRYKDTDSEYAEACNDSDSIKFWHHFNEHYSTEKYGEYEPIGWLDNAEMNKVKRMFVNEYYQEHPMTCRALCSAIKEYNSWPFPDLEPEDMTFGDDFVWNGRLIFYRYVCKSPDTVFLYTPRKIILNIHEAAKEGDNFDLYRKSIIEYFTEHPELLERYEKNASHVQ